LNLQRQAEPGLISSIRPSRPRRATAPLPQISTPPCPARPDWNCAWPSSSPARAMSCRCPL